MEGGEVFGIGPVEIGGDGVALFWVGIGIAQVPEALWAADGLRQESLEGGLVAQGLQAVEELGADRGHGG